MAIESVVATVVRRWQLDGSYPYVAWDVGPWPDGCAQLVLHLPTGRHIGLVFGPDLDSDEIELCLAAATWGQIVVPRDVFVCSGNLAGLPMTPEQLDRIWGAAGG